MNCTFFGHRDAPSTIKPRLKETIMQLLNEGIKHFYVGNNGSFDLLAQESLAELANDGLDIKYNIVLSYINELAMSGNQQATIFPEGQELAIPKFAISKRNEWLLNNSSVVIAYVRYSVSNSYKYIEKARKNGLAVVNLAKRGV